MISMMYMPVFDVDYLQKSIVQPLYAYEKKHNSITLKEIQDSIRIALMMVTGFRDILDDLNYDTVEKVFKTTSDFVTREMIEKLLTQMTKLDMEIGDFILEHHHAS